MEEVITIGRFQLESLQQNMLSFKLVWLSDNGPVESLLQTAEQVDPSELQDWVSARRLESLYPIVLACADGVASTKAAALLVSMGYVNVYVIDGGEMGIAQESKVREQS